MNTIFEDQVANNRASSLMGEITHTLDVLKNIDELMPGSSFERKTKVNPKIEGRI